MRLFVPVTVALLLGATGLPALSDREPEGAPLVPTGYQALVGPLHEHSGYSDGYPGSTPASYYASAAGFGNDFLFSGEHSDTLDAPLAANDECLGPDVTGCLVADSDPVKALTKWQAMQDYAVPGLVDVRSNGRTVVAAKALGPGGTVDFTLDEPGWVWAQLYADDDRRSACDTVVGTQTTYCRNRVGVLAMTSAMWVAPSSRRATQ